MTSLPFWNRSPNRPAPKPDICTRGLTSSDVLDTGLALQLVEAQEIILEDLDALLDVLHTQALKHKDTVMVGRSHGMHGEPVSFGFKMAIWYEEFTRQRKRLTAAGEDVAVGKFSGAMGTFAHVPPHVEKTACTKLGLRPAPVSNQVIQRDRHAAFLSTLALMAASVEKVAMELRHLQRTEVLEAEEYFSPGQKGSSAMPHKRNPVGSENLCGLARIIRANSLAAMENVALWHERDISHSSVERVIIPDGTILIDYMLVRLTNLLKRLVVYPERMRKNLNLTGGLIYSQRLLLALVKKGIERKAAYEAVQRSAVKTWGRAGELSRTGRPRPVDLPHDSLRRKSAPVLTRKPTCVHLDPRVPSGVWGEAQGPATRLSACSARAGKNLERKSERDESENLHYFESGHCRPPGTRHSAIISHAGIFDRQRRARRKISGNRSQRRESG